MPTIDPTFVEVNTATFAGSVVRSIGLLDAHVAPYIRVWPLAVSVVSGTIYPFNHVAGICDAAQIGPIHADYPHERAPFALECAPQCHRAADLIAYRDLGLAPVSESLVLACDLTHQQLPHVRSNLVWSENDGLEVTTDYVPADSERIIRRAYAMQPDATIVSLLHSDGIIASAGIRIAKGYAFCFGAWVAPHRRRRGHYATLLDARLRFAAEHDCHTIILQTQARSAVAAAAEARGFRHVWTRERWMEVHQQKRSIHRDT